MTPEEFGRKLKKLRETVGLTQEELSSKAGLKQGTLNNWEQGRCFPEIAQLISLCKGLGVGPEVLLDVGSLPGPEEYQEAVAEKERLWEELRRSTPARRRWAIAALDRAEKKVKFLEEQVLGRVDDAAQSGVLEVPLLGNIRAGVPSYAEEMMEGKIILPHDAKADYALRVKGDSMAGIGIYEGDVAICRRPDGEPPVDRIVVALVDNLDATLKVLAQSNGQWVLRAANPSYPDIIVNPRNDIIQGVVTTVLRDVNHEVHPDRLPLIDLIAKETGVPSQVIKAFLAAYSSSTDKKQRSPK